MHSASEVVETVWIQCTFSSWLFISSLLIERAAPLPWGPWPGADAPGKAEKKVKVHITQACPTLWDPMGCTVYGILQARILEWVAFPFSRGSSWPRNWTRVSCIAGRSLAKEAPLVPGIIGAESSFTCLSLQLPPSLLQKCLPDSMKCTNYSPLYALLLLLLSHFSRVRLCATPQTAAHQAPLSLGFSRQEPWSGLPFPSPMHESKKWKWSRSVLSDSSLPHGL